MIRISGKQFANIIIRCKCLIDRMSVLGTPPKILRSKFRIKPYLLFLTPLCLISILIICLELHQETGDSFQNFTYPSDLNFHEIYNAKEIGNFTILNDYRPRLINKIDYTNSSDIEVVIIVKSSIANSVKRNNIRQTWASRQCKKSHNLAIYFALGETSNETNIFNDLIEETQNYRDILQFDFVDNYLNNTYKVMAIMNHFVNAHSNVVPFLLIVDDDFFVDPQELMSTIRNNISKFEYDRYFGGHVWFQSVPQRTRLSKWYVTKKQYRFDYYPPYPSGGFMLISSPMAKRCDKLLPYLKYSSMDDILLGILLFKLNIFPVHLKTVITDRPWRLPEPLLALHGVSGDLIDIWQQRNDKKIMC